MRRSKKEIKKKIAELYKLATQNEIDLVRVILYTDALSYALGEDYLNFDYLKNKDGKKDAND